MIQSGKFDPYSILFQRVRAPRGSHNPFSFGSGMSGLEKETSDKLAAVFSWDYMGWAEYESGNAGAALAFMFDHRKELKAVEHEGFHFLVIAEAEQLACNLWQRVVTGHLASKHLDPRIDCPEILGWIDLTNGFFVSRTAEMRDALLALIMSYPDAVQT